MYEARFDRIDQRLDTVESGQNELRADVRRLDGRIEHLDRDMHALHEAAIGRIEDLDRRMHLLHEAAIGRIEDVDRHMHVLHEDVIARIAATPEYTGPTRAEFAELKEMLSRRLDPLEAAVRLHSVEIDQLKRRT
jgi:chromosome segregation ATPase